MGMITKASMLFSAAALFAIASPAAAVPGGPPIAYAVNGGKTVDVYLSNADGSGKVKVYSTTGKNNLWQIDVRPGGNQLALVEQISPSLLSNVKIISYSDSGVAGTPLVVAPSDNCQVLGVDYHPTNGSLLVSRYCNQTKVIEVRRLVNGVYDSSPIITLDNSAGTSAANYVRWLGDGSGFLWGFATVSGGGTIERHMLSSPYAPVTVYNTGSAALPTWFDVARCSGALDSSCSKILVTTREGVLHLVTFDSFGGTDQGVIHSPNATDGHYSPDNSQVLWRFQTHSGYQLMIDNSVFLAKGATGVKDWRQ
jgi:hypothetical protein